MPTMLFLLMDFVPTTLLKIEDKTSAEVAFLVSVPVVDLFDEDDKILPRIFFSELCASHCAGIVATAMSMT